MSDDAVAEELTEAQALARVVRSKFPEGNLILCDPHRWPDPPTDRAFDFHLGWWAALRMVAEMGDPALDDFEHGVATKISELAEDFMFLVGSGPTAGADWAEIVPHLHALQQTVLAQAAARAHPGRYRGLGDVEEFTVEETDTSTYRRISEEELRQ